VAASQANITSVGTLTGLTVSGLLIASNGSGISNINGSNVSTVPTAQSVIAAAQTNITSVGTLTGLTVSGLLIASNGSGISNINGSNVSTVGTALSVTAAAQTNITSVGTLTSLVVQGTSNILAANIANIYTTNIVGFIGSQWTGQTGSTIYYINPVGIGTSTAGANLTVSGNVYASNALSTGSVYLSSGVISQGTSNIAVANIANIYTTNISGFAFTGSQWTTAPTNIYYLGNVGIGTSVVSSNLTVTGNIYASNALSTGSAYLTGSLNVQGTANIATANITNIQTTNFIPAASGLFLNLYSTYTLTATSNWTGNIAGTITPNLYTLFVAPYSVPAGQWNSYGTSALVTAPTANGGIKFNQPGPYMITTVISADSGIKTIALSSNTGNTVDLHSNVTNVWQYCYRFPFGDVNPWPVTIPVNVTNTSQYYYLDIEANNQTDNIRQTAYTNVATLAYTGSYVIIRPV
jgi:hypothetical protein